MARGHHEVDSASRNMLLPWWSRGLDTCLFSGRPRIESLSPCGAFSRSSHTSDRVHSILRLRTGHCQFLSHLHTLNISHSDECPCGTGPQTPNHILQSCPTFDAPRRQTWPSPVDAHRKLWGPVETLRQTANLALLIGLKI